MFYFEEINNEILRSAQDDKNAEIKNNKHILKSDLIKDAEAFFTTRDICICDKTEGTPSSILPNPGKEDIKNNKKIIAEYLKISENNLISPTQTHSANIDVAIETRHDYPDCDALILTEKNLGIFLNFADCTPIILYDRKLNIGAVAHAGWRGTAQKIAPLTVEKLASDYGSKPSDIVALIGPAIGFCCYNVGEEVYQKLSETVENFEGLSTIITPSQPLPHPRKGYIEREQIFVDLKNINKRQLEEVGVKEIDVCPYCTVCDNDKFFSYRNENATTKRHSAVLKLI